MGGLCWLVVASLLFTGLLCLRGVAVWLLFCCSSLIWLVQELCLCLVVCAFGDFGGFGVLGLRFCSCLFCLIVLS